MLGYTHVARYAYIAVPASIARCLGLFILKVNINRRQFFNRITRFRFLVDDKPLVTILTLGEYPADTEIN